MALKKDFKRLLKPYYWVNILLSISYIFAKKIVPVCRIVFGVKSDCELDMRETEILFFLLIVVVIRTRKTGSVTMVNYLSSSFIYTKGANLILWFYADAMLGLAYAATVVLMALLLPEPAYCGPENVVYFRAGGLEDELNRDKNIVWLVVFYTAWNPACVNFAPIFAELSAGYSLDNLKFGKVDVGRFPEAGKKFRVDDSSLSRMLPSLILFKDGKEVIRRPAIDNSNKIVKFFFSEDNVKTAFDMNNIYNECKANPLKPSKKERKAENEKHAKSE